MKHKPRSKSEMRSGELAHVRGIFRKKFPKERHPWRRDALHPKGEQTKGMFQ